jgi:hypothetical protein
VRDGTRYEDNPGDIIEKTFESRDVGIGKLSDVDLEFHASPRPGEVIVEAGPVGRSYRIDAFKRYGGDPYILFSKPLHIQVGKYLTVINGATFFSVNAKMASISFGIPAGPDSENGSCPSSALPNSYQKHYVLGDVSQNPMDKDNQICRKCYANKGNFQYELQQTLQQARYRWIQERLAGGASSEDLADDLEAAIRTASANVKKRNADGENPTFVRIHDSGDLFDLRYWRAWKITCERLPNLIFWCPTRQWMIPEYTKNFKMDVPRNLALRPSAYHFNEKAPMIDGLAAGSTSNYWENKKGGLKIDPILSGIADWPCPAYVAGGTSCLGALERVQNIWTGHNKQAFDRLVGSMSREERDLTNNCKDCRVCWLRKDMRVSYTAH